MAAIEATRLIPADPASVALMLAGPTAAELLADPDALGGDGITVEITPPLRSGIRFAATLRVNSAGRLLCTGSLVVSPAAGDAALLSVTLHPAAAVNAAGLAQWLRRALDEFAEAARDRSFAA